MKAIPAVEINNREGQLTAGVRPNASRVALCIWNNDTGKEVRFELMEYEAARLRDWLNAAVPAKGPTKIDF